MPVEKKETKEGRDEIKCISTTKNVTLATDMVRHEKGRLAMVPPPSAHIVHY